MRGIPQGYASTLLILLSGAFVYLVVMILFRQEKTAASDQGHPVEQFGPADLMLKIH